MQKKLSFFYGGSFLHLPIFRFVVDVEDEERKTQNTIGNETLFPCRADVTTGGKPGGGFNVKKMAEWEKIGPHT